MSLFSTYQAYLADNPKGYWFKRKLYGWGWTPARWQGWVVTGAYLAAVMYFAVRADGTTPASAVLVPFVVCTLLLLLVTYFTGESPRWQWGLPKKDVDADAIKKQ